MPVAMPNTIMKRQARATIAATTNPIINAARINPRMKSTVFDFLSGDIA